MLKWIIDNFSSRETRLETVERKEATAQYRASLERLAQDRLRRKLKVRGE